MDCILQFCCELPRIVEALSIVANWRERASASKAYNLLQTVCSCEFITAVFSLFAGGGFHAMRQRLQSELNHLSAEDP